MIELLKSIFLIDDVKITWCDFACAVIGCVCLFAIIWSAAALEFAIMGA